MTLDNARTALRILRHAPQTMSPLVLDAVHVLVLTHEPGVSTLASQLAGRAVVCHVASLESREDLRARMVSLDPDVMIVDALTAGDGDVVDDLLRTWPNLPVIIVDRTQPAHAWSTFVARGVDDVLPGEATGEQLERAVQHAVLRRHRSMPLAAPLASLTDIQLAAFINLMPEPAALIDAAGRPLAVNDAYCDLAGCTREDALAYGPEQLLKDFVPAAMSEQRMTPDGRLYLRGGIARGEQMIDVDVTTARIRRDRYQMILRDISHQVRADAELRESEVRFRALAESSPTAIYIEQDRQAVYANRAAAALTGVPLESLLGRDPVSFVHPDWREQLEERRRLRLGGENVQSRYEVKMQGHDGRDRWLDLTAAAITYRGRPALLVNAIDITDRKRLEEQLLLRGRLDAVGRLAGGIAHDFNNLLQVVHGHVERLLETVAPAHPLHDSIEAIRGAATRATTLTEQLLAVGRRQMLVPKSVDLNELVSRFSSLMLRALPKHIRLRVNQASDLPPVRIDETRLEQALSHLVSNACEAMPEAGDLTIVTKLVNVSDQELTPRLRLERASAQPGTYVAVEVIDTGRGMTPEVMAQAFEPFFTTKPNSPGAGLGLSTVYGIVKQSGGYITGESTPGKGTCWSIWLPPAIAAVPAQADLHPLPANLRILLIEDEPAVRSLLYETLTREGLNVVALGSAEEALESWVEDAFDVLITDVGLPDLTGPDLAKELLDRQPDLRVVFISGYVADSLGSSGIDPNAVFLQKPFNPRELARRVRQVAAHTIAKPSA